MKERYLVQQSLVYIEDHLAKMDPNMQWVCSNNIKDSRSKDIVVEGIGIMKRMKEA